VAFVTDRRERRFCSGGCYAAAVRARSEPPYKRPPTPAEIRARAGAVRATWTARQLRQRLRWDWRIMSWRVPEVRNPCYADGTPIEQEGRALPL
jgi:hypothetical protein